MTIDELKAEALRLSPDERAELASELLVSLDNLSETEIERLWLEEAIRRDAELDSGAAQAVPADERLQVVWSRTRAAFPARLMVGLVLVTAVASTACTSTGGTNTTMTVPTALVNALTDTTSTTRPAGTTAPTGTTPPVSAKPGRSPSTTVLIPAVDSFLKMLRLDVSPRQGVRVVVGGLREVASDHVDPRERLIEGEVIVENRSDTPFTCGPGDFRLYVGPFRPQILGMTASTDFPVTDAILSLTKVGDHAFMSEGIVQPGATLHGYVLTWVADRGTLSSGLQFTSSDARAGKGSWMTSITP